MRLLKPMLGYLLTLLAGYYLLPLAAGFAQLPDSVYSVLLMIILPLMCFFAALIYGARNGFSVLFPVIAAVLFVPAVFLLFTSKEWIYILAYFFISLAGCVLGNAHRWKK